MIGELEEEMKERRKKGKKENGELRVLVREHLW